MPHPGRSDQSISLAVADVRDAMTEPKIANEIGNEAFVCRRTESIHLPPNVETTGAARPPHAASNDRKG
jgi:hypothetical protein